ncbi:unnamed protein product [Cyprideis torosa]|uniref:Uncharacterized protein n=1 Tax=Cyprideis torosa TaxID=163714 RepID=A0A7R8W6S4_9CRUS|nr:unnamed protein product [Cyprideis torosa]CAG0881616.1 unnamed protein product [Cyprideis torosa]
MGPKHILLTGSPGVGKTTLVEKVVELCRRSNVPVEGFFTREVRGSGGRRVGFDIITLDGQTGPLARIDPTLRGPTVGQYTVTLDSLESLTLPLLLKADMGGILVIDEIGKMELYSKRFTTTVRKAFADPAGARILATIPVKGLHSLPLVEELRSRPDVRVVEVSRQNRDSLDHKLFTLLQANSTDKNASNE